MKTLAVKLEDGLHAQLTALANLEGVPVTEAIRQAIESHVARLRTSEDLSAKAAALLEDIEREANSRREAITALLNGDSAMDPPTASRSRRSRESEKTE
jgi:hypothetical protein